MQAATQEYMFTRIRHGAEGLSYCRSSTARDAAAREDPEQAVNLGCVMRERDNGVAECAAQAALNIGRVNAARVDRFEFRRDGKQLTHRLRTR